MVSQFAFAESVTARCIAGSPARQRGNFLLRGQKKVTKEEALNRTRAPRAGSAQGNKLPLPAKTRPAALSLLSLSPAPSIAPAARLTRGCTPCSPEIPKTASLGRRNVATLRSALAGWGERSGPQRRPAHPLLRRPIDAVFPGEPGVQPALTGVKGRWMALFTGTAARAQRVASGRDARVRFRATLVAPSQSCAVQRLFFGDFLLAKQKKVTPPPGGTPGTLPPGKRRPDQPSRQQS
jgi:hypothetical protein